MLRGDVVCWVSVVLVFARGLADGRMFVDVEVEVEVEDGMLVCLDVGGIEDLNS